MKSQDFTLVLDVDQISAEQVEALFAAGCDDALICSENGVFRLDFTRETKSYQSALVQAKRRVEQVLGKGCVARVVRLGHDSASSGRNA